MDARPTRSASLSQTGLANFDALLFAHVLEHITYAQAIDLVKAYRPYLSSAGRVLMICPQERGFGADPTHVTLLGPSNLNRLLKELGLEVVASSTFPFPRRAGRWFTYDETHVLARAGRW